MDLVVQPVLGFEETFRRRDRPARIGLHGMVEADYVAAGAKGALAAAQQHHASDIVVLRPLRQPRAQQIDHGLAERVERFFSVQPGETDALAAASRALLEYHYLGCHFFSSSGSRYLMMLEKSIRPAPCLL